MATEEISTPNRPGKKQNLINKLFQIPLPKSKTAQGKKKELIGDNEIKQIDFFIRDRISNTLRLEVLTRIKFN